MAKSILVTGGAGYIGSHACKALSAAGYRPVVLDNLVYGHEAYVKWGPLVVGNIADHALVARLIKDHDVQGVMHFAAYAYVGESVTDPAKYYENNVTGTLGLLRGMRDAGCDNLVFSSTCAVYGQPDVLPITEDTPTAPMNPYGRSKLMCEDIIRDYTSAYALRHFCLRYFNASGADPESEVGELREVETHLIPRAIMAIQGYVDDFQVFGSDFPTPDGTAIRDYIHVADLAAAHVLAMNRLLDGTESNMTINLGTGEGYSVGEVLRKISEVSGRSLPSPVGDRRRGDPASLVADVSRAREKLGFVAAASKLDSIIETAWRWHLKAHPRKNTTVTSR